MSAHTSSDHGDCRSENKGLQLRNGKKRYEQLDANVNKLHQHQQQEQLRQQQQQQQEQEPQEAPPSEHRTLRAEEVDFVFREPFILTGYRLPNQPWRYYLASVLWLHNETLNVWTHAIGCVLVLARALLLVWQLGGLGAPRAWPVLGFALGCCVNNLLSSSAHLLHSRSPRHHYVLYILDYAGITFYSLANGVGAMYSCSHPAVFARMESFFLPAAVVLAWLSFLACVLARLRYKGHVEIERKLVMVSVFVALAAFISWPMVERYTDCVRDEGCSLASLNHITFVFVFFALDGVLYAAHAPERWWPGGVWVWPVVDFGFWLGFGRWGGRGEGLVGWGLGLVGFSRVGFGLAGGWLGFGRWGLIGWGLVGGVDGGRGWSGEVGSVGVWSGGV